MKVYLKLKKICAVITAVCFIFAIVNNNLFASINVDTIQSQKQYFDSKDKDCLISSKYGKVLSYRNNGSETIVINIQDLHCDYAVQKNIVAIILSTAF